MDVRCNCKWLKNTKRNKFSSGINKTHQEVLLSWWRWWLKQWHHHVVDYCPKTVKHGVFYYDIMLLRTTSVHRWQRNLRSPEIVLTRRRLREPERDRRKSTPNQCSAHTREQENAAEKHRASFLSNEADLFDLRNKQSLWASEATGADGACVPASATKPACLRAREAGWTISRSICQWGRAHRPTVSSTPNDSLQTSHLLL